MHPYITHVYANFRENIYVLRSNSGVFQHHMIHGGVNSLFLKHASLNRVEHGPSTTARRRSAGIPTTISW
jgi:hypothetical protein